MLKNTPTFFSLLVISSALLALSACQSTSGCVQDETQCFGSAKPILKKVAQTPTLNSQFDYVRLNMNGQIVWLAQGSTDQWPKSDAKVYYSADRSVFRWANGRLVAVTMPKLNWRERMDVPTNWLAARPQQFSREVDTSNGEVAVKEQRELTNTTAPQHHDFIGDSQQLVWMQESTVSRHSAMIKHPNFNSWYAFHAQNLTTPVYGQQCISKQYCLSWQVWKTP